MEFKRIDNDTVRCIITEEDMQEYNVELEDFFKDKGKIQEFLHTIVEQAVDAVGFEPKDGMVSMQVMPMSQNRIAITFSENSVDDVGGILKQINGMVNEMDGMMKEDTEEEEKPEGLVGAPEPESSKEEKEDKASEEKESEVAKKEKTKRVRKKDPLSIAKRIYRFPSLDNVEEFAKLVPEKWTVKSYLFKDVSADVYYLSMEKGRLSKLHYAYLCNCITEFGTYVDDNATRFAYMEEHYDCMVEKKALKVMRNMALL
ncbi:negative regulator of genetic competence MecA [Lachnospiraceae bacterium KM106-2]|nr:negative regulator of genetic competence MecA [Lachnospiraceae bacterium KM106-2]